MLSDTGTEDRLAQRRLHADKALIRLNTHGRDDLQYHRLLVLGQVDRHFIVELNLSRVRFILINDLCGLDHVLQIAHTAVIAALRLLCRLVLIVLAEVAELAGALDLLHDLRALVEASVLQLGLHEGDVLFCQFIIHS